MLVIPGREYVVRFGDTLPQIAQRAYGDGSQNGWRRIYHANWYQIGSNPGRIRPGQILRIPLWDIMPGSEYTVQAGDTLSQIAARAYGDRSRASWRIIYEANRSVIGADPDHLTAGQVLYIPL